MCVCVCLRPWTLLQASVVCVSMYLLCRDVCAQLCFSLTVVTAGLVQVASLVQVNQSRRLLMTDGLAPGIQQQGDSDVADDLLVAAESAWPS